MPSPSLLLLVFGGVLLLLALNALRPLRWPGFLAVVSFFASWLVDELILHHLGWQVVAVVGLVGLGGLAEPRGWGGAAMAAAAWGLMMLGLRRSRVTGRVLDASLRAGLGEDYQRHLEAGLMQVPWSVDWWRVAWILPFRRRDVDVTRDIVFASPKGRDLKLDVYRKKGAQGLQPTLLFVHGGGWIIGDKEAQGLMTVNHLAASGWTCVNISYRLSPRATFPEHLIDVKQAIRWVREHGREHGCDPGFIVMAGGSAGAHLASLASLTPNNPDYQPGFEQVDTTVQGCVGYYGVYDFTDREGHWPHRELRLLLELLIMKRKFSTDREAYERASPVYQVGPHAPPFLLLHGDRDSLAPVDEGRAFAKALRASSKSPVVYAELPGAQHAFEIFSSIRSTVAIQAVERFGAFIHRQHRERRAVDAGLKPGARTGREVCSS